MIYALHQYAQTCYAYEFYLQRQDNRKAYLTMRGMLMTMMVMEQMPTMTRMRWQGEAWEGLKWLIERKLGGDNKTCLDRPPVLIIKHVWGRQTATRAARPACKTLSGGDRSDGFTM